MKKLCYVLLLSLFVSLAYANDGYRIANWDPANSNNYTVGRGGNSVQYVIIHVVQGSYKGCISWFKNPDAKVSAHYVVSKQGEITQMVKESDTAWHAGNWSYNQRSVGIEHEGFIADPSFTDAMYRKSAALVSDICDRYGIPKNRSHIIGHVEVPKATHTDPGNNWNWDKFMSYILSNNVVAQESDVQAIMGETVTEEYKVKTSSVHYNVEKLQKRISGQQLKQRKFQEIVQVSNIFESTVAIDFTNVDCCTSFDCHLDFPQVWSENKLIEYPKTATNGAELTFIYDQYEFEIWHKVFEGEWQKVGTGIASEFKGYKINPQN